MRMTKLLLVSIASSAIAFAGGFCVAHQSQPIHTIFAEQPNGDYRVTLSGRSLVCEERDVQILQQPDAVTPLVLECKH